MDFVAVVDQAITLLRQRGRLTYRPLQRQFQLDDAALEDLKDELIYGQRLAVDEEGRVLVWSGETETSAAATPAGTPAPALLAYTPPYLAEKILTSRSALEGERKQVTVLFADVVGFTTLAEQLDPEVVHDIINRCFERITAEVHRFERTINQYTGDGVMALFGAPIAHEDSPRRAVHAALGIQRAMHDVAQALQAERGLSLQMRLGLNTGLVVVGKIGDDLRMDYTAVGDTTNLAARLQQMAQPGSIVISAVTHQHIAGFFETRDLGKVAVKGRAPTHAFEVVRPRGSRTRFDVAVERGLTPLVGRERELATLRERFREVKAGRGQVVGIAGDAGLGKSRLVLEFRRALAHAGDVVTWLEGHCISFGQASPFLPLTEQLRTNFRIDEVDGEPEIIAKIEQGMRRMGDLEAHIPAIRYLLSVDPGDPAFATMEGTARRRHLFAALRALPIRGAQLRPLVLVVEDLHWIDTSSEEFLTFLLDAVAGVPLLLLVTYRIGYTPPFGSRSFSTTLTLRNFSETETLAMASHVLGTAQCPAEIHTALLEKAEGVPLFIEEVTKTLLDLGVLQREEGGYRLVKSLSEVNVPETIQGIIMARLDRLGDDGKRTLQLASVIGRQAGEQALARSAHREAVGSFEQALAVFQHLPETRDRREQAIDLRLALRSALLPAGDLERILALLHEAEALAATLGDQRRLGQVSLFLTVHFYQRGAYDQAIIVGQRALVLATADGSSLLQALANQYLGVSYQTQGDYKRAIAYFQDTVAFLDGARRRERFGQVILPAVYTRAFLAWCYAELGLFAEGSARGEEGLQIIETVDHPGSLMFMYWGRGVGALRQGDVQRALPLLERAMSVCHTADLPGFVPRVAPTLGEAYVLCGRVADALSLLTPAMEQTMAAAMIVYQALCQLALGQAQLLAGALEEARSLAHRALVIARQHRERGNQAYALRLLGEIAAQREPPESEQADEYYRQALILAEELGMRPLVAHCRLGLGTLYAATGQREQARAELSTAIEMYQTMEMTFCLPQAETALAQVEAR